MSRDVDEWIEKSNPAGSGRYYALLHSDADLQTQQRLITTLISIFSKLGFQSREIEVAKHKLEWWRAELEKDTFNHPVMAELNSSAVSPTVQKLLKQLLNGYGTLLESGSPSTDEQNKQFHLNTGASACQLLCMPPAHYADDHLANNGNRVVSDLGVLLSKFRCYRYLRQHVDSGLLCLPMSALDAADISPALLTPTAANESVKNFLAQNLMVLQEEMQSGTKALESTIQEQPADVRTRYKALYVYLALQTKLLQVMRTDELSVVEQVTRLTPIRNYWYAYRAARRFDKISRR